MVDELEYALENVAASWAIWSPAYGSYWDIVDGEAYWGFGHPLMLFPDYETAVAFYPTQQRQGGAIIVQLLHPWYEIVADITSKNRTFREYRLRQLTANYSTWVNLQITYGAVKPLRFHHRGQLTAVQGTTAYIPRRCRQGEVTNCRYVKVRDTTRRIRRPPVVAPLPILVPVDYHKPFRALQIEE